MDSQNSYLSEPAQRRLDALRSSVDVRLAALEAALADPAQGDSLEQLILELARAAAEEAQAAAAKACVDTRLEADMRIAQARAAVQSVLDEERAANAALRRDADQARQRLTDIERNHRAAMQSARDQLDAELMTARAAMEEQLAREQTRAAELERLNVTLERAVGDADARSQSDHATVTDLRSDLDRADQRLAALKSDLTAATVARQQLEEDLARERAAAAENDRTYTDTRTALAVERNALAESRRAAARAADQLTTLGRRESEARDAHDQLALEHERLNTAHERVSAELVAERQQATDLRRELAAIQARLESEAGDLITLRQAAADADARAAKAVEVERASTSDLQQVIDEANQRLSALLGEKTREQLVRQEAQEALALARVDAQSARADLAKVRNQLDKARTDVEKAKGDVERLKAEKQALVDRQREHEAAPAGSDGVEEAVAIARVESQALRSDLASAKAEIDRLTSDRQGLEDLQREHVALQARFDAEQMAAAETGRKLADALTHHEKTQEGTENTREALAAANAEAQSLRSDLASAQADIDRLTSDRQALEALRVEYAALQTRLEAEHTIGEEASRKLADVLTNHERAQSGAEDAQQELTFARSEIQTLKEDLERARTRVESLAGERGDLERQWKEAEGRLKVTERERDELRTELDTAGRSTEPVKKPAHVPLDVLPSPAYKVPHRPGGPRPPAKPKVSEDEWQSVRLAVRYSFTPLIDVQINNGSGFLCDLSVGGCQLLSMVALKPNQPVKVILPFEPKPITCSGKIVWAKLEAPVSGRPSGYRAGVQFSKSSESAIEAFIANHHPADKRSSR